VPDPPRYSAAPARFWQGRLFVTRRIGR
jgi:hypothetical protein